MTEAEKKLLDLVLSVNDGTRNGRERGAMVQSAKLEVMTERCSPDIIDTVRQQLRENFESNRRWKATLQQMDRAGLGLMFFGEQGLVSKWWDELDAERRAKGELP